MDITNRIDSEKELAEFIHKLMMADIEIPSNVSLEIDSIDLKYEMQNTTSKWIPKFELKKFEYMGQKITFKS